MSKSKNFFEALYCPTDGSTPFTSKPFFLIKSRISPVPEPTSRIFSFGKLFFEDSLIIKSENLEIY